VPGALLQININLNLLNLYFKVYLVPRSKQFVTAAINAVDGSKKEAVCGQKVEILNVRLGGTK
jgi:hypothetical protein